MNNLYYDIAAKTHNKALDVCEYVGNKLKKRSNTVVGGAMIAMVSSGVYADASLKTILDAGKTTAGDVVAFIMTIAVLMGVGGILYGLKLIMDKSNERENVKNSHIAFSLVGGAFLLVLWYVIGALGVTAGGGANKMGQSGTW